MKKTLIIALLVGMFLVGYTMGRQEGSPDIAGRLEVKARQAWSVGVLIVSLIKEQLSKDQTQASHYKPPADNAPKAALAGQFQSRQAEHRYYNNPRRSVLGGLLRQGQDYDD